MPVVLCSAQDAEATSEALRPLPGWRAFFTYVLPESVHDRDAAVTCFAPLAAALEHPLKPRLLVGGWAFSPTSPTYLRRTLDRTALSTGAVWLRVRQPDSARTATDSHGVQVRLARLTLGAREPARVLGARLGDTLGLAANLGPGAGAWSPGGALLVGERPHVARSGQLKHRLPFVSFSRDGCAAWLAEELERYGVPESELYWVNAYDALGIPTSPDFVNRLQPRRVIAMGRLAERWAQNSGITSDYDVRVVPHPQYWKRFHYSEPYPLQQALR